MFLAFLTLCLITCFNYEKFYKENIYTYTEPSRPIITEYNNMDGILIDSSHCGIKPCIIKCCGDRRYLDYEGICRSELFFEKMFHDSPSLGMHSWKEVIKEIKNEMKYLNRDFTLVQSVQNFYEPVGNFSDVKFYLRRGTLNYTKESNPEHWIELKQLRFCIDFSFKSFKQNNKMEFIFLLAKDPQDNMDRLNEIVKRNILNFNYAILATGMVITILSISWFLFHLRKQVEERYMSYTLLAYICSLTLAYGLKILYLVGINTGVFTASHCKYICIPLYFLLVSAFCWPLALTRYLLASTRSFVRRKFIDILILIILVQVIPDIPVILYVVLYIYCAITWHVLIITAFYEKTIFVNFYKRVFQAKDEERTISNNDLEEDNNKAIVSINILENNLRMLLIWIWQMKNNICDMAKFYGKDAENGQDSNNISTNDDEAH